MTTLPDLDPNTAGHVAFYNAVEQGGLAEDMMTWSDVTDNTSVNSYDVYDNGLIVRYDDDAWGNITIRLKTDGWVVAYTRWGGSSPGTFDGPAPHNISAFDGVYNNLTNNRLVKAIEDMLSDLTDWPSQVVGTFSKSDVGLYDFAHASDGISLFVQSVKNKTTITRSASQASGTNQHVATAFVRSTNSGNARNFDFDIDGTEVYSGSGDDGYTQDISNAISSTGSVQMHLNTGNGNDHWTSMGAVFYWSG